MPYASPCWNVSYLYRVQYLHGNNTAFVTAMKPLKVLCSGPCVHGARVAQRCVLPHQAGSELLVTYIDEDAPLSDRRIELQYVDDRCCFM